MTLRMLKVPNDVDVIMLFYDMPRSIELDACELRADEPETRHKYDDFCEKHSGAEVRSVRLIWRDVSWRGERRDIPCMLIGVGGVYDEIWSLPENQNEEDEPVEEDTPSNSEAEPEIKEDAELTNADRIRSMSDEELADFLIFQEEEAQEGAAWEVPSVCLRWLQSTDKEEGGYF